MTRSADPGPRRSSRLYGPRSSKEPQLHDPTDARNEGFPASHGRQPVGLSLHVLWVPLPMGATSATLSPVGPPPGTTAYGASFPWLPLSCGFPLPTGAIVSGSQWFNCPYSPSIPTAHPSPQPTHWAPHPTGTIASQ